MKKLKLKKSWFGVRTLFLTYEENKGKKVPLMSEERVVLFKVFSFDEAIRFAEEEAKEYSKGSYKNSAGNRVEFKYLNACDAFELFDGKIRHGAEVYSMMQFVRKNTSRGSIINSKFGPLHSKKAGKVAK